MQPSFERAIEMQKYFVAFMAMFKVFLHQRPPQNCDDAKSFPQMTGHPTSLESQSIYQDPDPPTPHWGC